jgi:response regulator RpfG family c-di-GMP phosphodiesterase
VSDAPRALIVCVDDDRDVLLAITRTLRTLPVDVVATDSPRDALDMVALKDVAVIISDYEMPTMNGVELVAAAKRLRPETVRMLVTGHRTYDTAVDGINQGEVFRYIGKPFMPVELRAAVTEAVAKHQELTRSSSELERATRRERLTADLELEHPGLTKIERERDGSYLVPLPDLAQLAAVGLAALTDLARRR